MELYYAVLLFVASGFLSLVAGVLATCFLPVIVALIMSAVEASEKAVVTAFCILSLLLLPLGVNVSVKLFGDFAKKESPERVVVMEPVTVERFILVGMNPPKHFYVSLKHETSGLVYERQYVSKHCNNYQDNKVGASYNLKTQKWYYKDEPETKYMKFVGLSGEFC